MFDDRSLICRDCGASFVFTSGEQQFYDRKGFTNVPSRCPDCRKSGGRSRGSEYSSQSTWADSSTPEMGGFEREPEQLFAAICSECGKPTRASAEILLGDSPVYCADCLAQRTPSPYASTGGWRDSW